MKGKVGIGVYFVSTVLKPWLCYLYSLSSARLYMLERTPYANMMPTCSVCSAMPDKR